VCPVRSCHRSDDRGPARPGAEPQSSVLFSITRRIRRAALPARLRGPPPLPPPAAHGQGTCPAQTLSRPLQHLPTAAGQICLSICWSGSSPPSQSRCTTSPRSASAVHGPVRCVEHGHPLSNLEGLHCSGLTSVRASWIVVHEAACLRGGHIRQDSHKSAADQGRFSLCS
jgi:hypothetical protein